MSQHSPVTLKDVAAMAGVSISAVSRVFTPGASVAPATRAKVEEAARTLGYAPSMIARGLMTGKTRLVGLIVNNFANPAYLDVFDSFTALLQQGGYRPILINIGTGMDAAAALALLRQYGVDGVIIATSTLPDDFDLLFRNAGLPTVHCFGRTWATPAVHVAGIDNRAGGALAARTLVEAGYRRVVALGGPQTATSTIDRLSGFEAEARIAGLEIAAVQHASAYTYQSGFDAMDRLLAEWPFEAVFCGDDVIAFGAMERARRNGLTIPDDLGFIGFNDITMAGWDSYRLTTIRQPFAEIVSAAVDLIVAAMDHPAKVPEIRQLDVTLVMRNSLASKADR